MQKTRIAMMVGALVAAAAISVRGAEPEGWSFEITPYAWLAGIDGDVTVKGQKVHVKQSFSDLIDKVDLAGAVIAIANYNRWQVFAQGDFFSLSDSATAPDGTSGKADSDTYIFTGGAGYQFNGPLAGSRIGVLAGVRYTHLDNQVKVSGIGDFKKTGDITDALFMLRPSIPIIDRLRFNPTMDIGAGDSDLTYELQPEFQYNFTDSVAARLGYRRVYYKEKQSSGTEFDGSFSGFLVGLGVTF